MHESPVRAPLRAPRQSVGPHGGHRSVGIEAPVMQSASVGTSTSSITSAVVPPLFSTP